MLTSLRLRLALLVLIALLPATVALVSTVRTERGLLEDAARGAALGAARQVGADHARAVDESRGLLLSLAHVPAVLQHDGPACEQVVRAMLHHTGAIYTNIAAADPAGDVFCSAVPLEAPVNVADRSYFTDAVATRTFALGGLQLGRVTRKPGVNLGYPTYDDAGVLRAVVYVAIDASALASLSLALPSPAGSTVTLLDRDGTALSRTPADPAVLGHPVPDLVPVLAEARRGALGDDVAVDLGDHLVALAPLGEGEDAWVAVSVPRSALFAAADQRFRASLVAVAVLAALTIAAAAWAAEALVGRRVRALSDFAGRIAAGDLAARSPLARERDEIGALARALDAMAEALETDQRRRAELERQLRQSQKMEVVGRLSGGVAHDFNNLLTAILGYGELLRDRLGPQAGFRELDEMIKSAHRASALTRQLLAFSRQEPYAPRVLDPNALVRGTEKLLRRLLGEGVTLDLALDPAVRNVRADAAQLEQVLLNLAVNARDAMSRGGTLTVRTRPGPDGRVALEVQDDGVGMPPDVQARIFEPFFTTKATGTGLGLAIVRDVVALAGGTIAVTSAPGKGSTFRIELPGTSERPDPVGEPEAPAIAGTETVLLVEDDAAVRTFVRRALEGEGYLVIEAVDAEDAEACADAHLGPVHLVLTDVVLPGGIDGAALVERLRVERPEIVALYMTGYGVPPRPDGSPRRDVLQKPFGARTVLKRVRTALDGRLEQPSEVSDRPSALPGA